jgi:uncharacterized RDD family membrane protein YckC
VFAQGRGAGLTDLRGASTAEHIWFATADTKNPETVRLYHHALQMEGPYYRTPTELPGMPAMIAAYGDSAWLVFDPPPNQGRALRDVYTIRAERNPATGIFYYVPDTVPKLVDGFTAEGALVGFAAEADGPVALLAPYDWAEAGVRREADDGGAGVPTSPRLLALQRGQWVDEPPPPLADGDRPVGLIALPENGRIVFAQRRAGSRQSIVAYRRAAAGPWTVVETGITARSVRSLGSQGGRLLLSMAAEGAESGDVGGARVGFFRSGQFVPLAAVPYEGDALLIAGTQLDVRIVRVARDGAMAMQVLDPMTGLLEPRQTMAGQPLSTASRVYFPLIATVFTVALLLAILVRPANPAVEKTAPALQPAPIALRCLALLADFAPAGFVAIAITQSELRDLLSFPLWATTVSEAAPIIVAAFLTGLHGAVGEAFWKASFGKGLVGLRVISADGNRPKLWQAVIRNVLKSVCIIMPPLAVFALLNPYRQQLGDAVARTIVVAEPDDGEGAEPSRD